MSEITRPKGVLFDLDGTFADTAPDLAYALNLTLRHYGEPALPFDRIRPVVSHGGMALIKLGFGLSSESPEFERRRRTLLRIYEENICRETRLFSGMPRLIDDLDIHGLPWGIVTNKPAWLTDPLMDALGLTERASAIVSGDTCNNRKPHPEPILYACEQLGVQASECVYIGDAERDIEAGRAAGSVTIAALYGYLLEDDNPNTWRADAFVESPDELNALLGLVS